MVATNCKTIYAQNMVCFRCIIVNNLHKFVVVADDDDDDMMIMVK
jgi:hypothetical protein